MVHSYHKTLLLKEKLMKLHAEKLAAAAATANACCYVLAGLVIWLIPTQAHWFTYLIYTTGIGPFLPAAEATLDWQALGFGLVQNFAWTFFYVWILGALYRSFTDKLA